LKKDLKKGFNPVKKSLRERIDVSFNNFLPNKNINGLKEL